MSDAERFQGLRASGEWCIMGVKALWAVVGFLVVSATALLMRILP